MRLVLATVSAAVLTATATVTATPAFAAPDPRLAAAISKAAGAYKSWGRVDREVRIAPTDCAAPSRPGPPPRVRLSAATTDSPHGQKLFYLFASDRNAYLADGGTVPIGFSVVKESFAAVPAAATTKGDVATDAAGHSLTVGARKDLFVMVKVGAQPGAASSDDGWIYGTVSPAGDVTSAGRVATCMGCHDGGDAKRERLFGLSH